MTPPEELKPCCESCKFSHKDWGHQGYTLFCRRHAPQSYIYQYEDNGRLYTRPKTYWPEVSLNDYCGEHEAKGVQGE